MFNTKEPVTVEVRTGTEKYEETIKKEWDKGETEHAISILGLYPGVENKVEITVPNETGNTTTSEIKIETEDLPDDLMESTLVAAHKESMGDGLTYILPTSGYLYAVDANADVRWYSSKRSRMVFTYLDEGRYLQATRKDDEEYYNELLELDMLGKLHNAYNIEIDGY